MSHTTGPSPARPLAFLLRRSALNALRKTVVRLKEPRYLLGFLAGLAYFGWMIWIISTDSEIPGAATEFRSVLDTAIPPFLGLFVLSWWIAGKHHRSLAFTPAETEILFSAPLSRRTLIQYKLVKTQPGMVFFAAMASLFGMNFLQLPLVLLFPTLWVLFTTMQLHQVGASLVRTSWTQQGRAGLRRNRVPFALFLAAVGAFCWSLPDTLVRMREATSGQEIWWAMEWGFGQATAALALLPFHLLLAPLTATTVPEWAWFSMGAMGLLFLHYGWVIRTGVAFEETAAAAGLEAIALRKAMKRGQLSVVGSDKKRKLSRPWFRLRPQGHPAMAIFWKNFTAFTRMVGGSTVFISLIFPASYVVLLYAADTVEEAAGAAASMPGMLAVMTLMMGPVYLRNDLRTDLSQQEVVRTFPLAGRHLVFAGLAAAALSLTLLQAGLLFYSMLIALLAPPVWPWWWVLLLAYPVVVVLLLLLNAVGVAVQNILAVNFPAWIDLGPEPGQGIDAMGSQMVMMLITLVLLALALLFPLTVATFVVMKLLVFLGAWVLLPAALAAVATLVGEVVLTAVLLGEAYEEMDPAEAGLLK